MTLEPIFTLCWGRTRQKISQVKLNFALILGPYIIIFEVIDQHMEWACEAGIGTFIVSYFANGRTGNFL